MFREGLLIIIVLTGYFNGVEAVDEAYMSLISLSNWLLSVQDDTGLFNTLYSREYPCYRDALILGYAAMVLLEVYRLTRSPEYLDAANKTLSLLLEWQSGEGGWPGHTKFGMEGIFYPLMAYSKYKIYTGSGIYDNVTLKAALRLSNLIRRKGVKYVFEAGEYCYALQLAWEATGNPEVRESAADVLSLIVESFDGEAGAWNTDLNGNGPAGIWDAALPALPLLNSGNDTLKAMAAKSMEWAYENLRSAELGGYRACIVTSEVVVTLEAYMDVENTYTHFTAEYLILSSILGHNSSLEALNWLLGMQSDEGGFYYRKTYTGVADERIYLWDSLWAGFGLVVFLNRMGGVYYHDFRVKLLGEVDRLKRAGLWVNDTLKLISEADSLLREGLIPSALQKLGQAAGELNKSYNAFTEISRFENMTVDMDMRGCNVSHLYAMVSKCWKLYNRGMLHEATMIVRQGVIEAERAEGEARAAARARIERASQAVSKALKYGVRVDMAECYLSIAFSSYYEGKYTSAIGYAKMAEDLAMDRLNSRINTLKYLLTLSAGAFTLTLILVSRRRGRRPPNQPA